LLHGFQFKKLNDAKILQQKQDTSAETLFIFLKKKLNDAKILQQKQDTADHTETHSPTFQTRHTIKVIFVSFQMKKKT
jgi:hypothetical protein